MTFIDRYQCFLSDTLKLVYSNNAKAMEQAARYMYECEKNNACIYTFGSGHSHMIGQDLYARAGGYAKIYPIVEIEMTLATHPTKSTQIEHCASYADILDHLYNIKKQDVLIITSNSGRNPLIIEFALRAKEKGANIIAITSLTHSKTIASRHTSGLRLYELADVVLDNMAPYGDAAIQLDTDTRMGPISTITGCYIAQCIVGRFVEMLIDDGIKVPVFKSSNMDHSDTYNQKLFDSYIKSS